MNKEGEVSSSPYGARPFTLLRRPQIVIARTGQSTRNGKKSENKKTRNDYHGSAESRHIHPRRETHSELILITQHPRPLAREAHVDGFGIWPIISFSPDQSTGPAIRDFALPPGSKEPREMPHRCIASCVPARFQEVDTSVFGRFRPERIDRISR